MNTHKNMAYDFLIDASHVNTTLRRMKLHRDLYNPEDQVEKMMYEWMIRKLETVRDSLEAQGLRGLQYGNESIREPAVDDELNDR